MDVSISRFRAQLKHWLERAQHGEEIVVTDHGKPIARVIGATRLTRLEELERDGVITPAPGPKISIRDLRRVPVKGSVSDLISEMRGE